jgi:hypothetical protein
VVLVRGGAPAAVDDEFDTGASGVSRSAAQGAKEGWVEVGDTRKLLVEDRRGTGKRTAGLAERITLLVA